MRILSVTSNNASEYLLILRNIQQLLAHHAFDDPQGELFRLREVSPATGKIRSFDRSGRHLQYAILRSGFLQFDVHAFDETVQCRFGGTVYRKERRRNNTRDADHHSTMKIIRRRV